ncbi:hypothetical protein [Cellulophaga baltica]|uniref:hypothetical protein n=1 Tax=Cellulophaga baltica TaxID=76594 RepID=UPI0024942E4C|nr:hypothetical protein [Cellulophaga baltica]
MNAYRVIDRIQIEPHIVFIRIEPTDIKVTLRDVFKSLSDIAWISDFDKQYIQDYFQVRSEETINYIATNIIAQSDDKITSDTGELVVSELSRLAVINELRYLDIPLAELIKSQAAGNDGFDFFSKNLNKIILFGEAKFNSRQNAYGSAFEQIARFERTKQDISDIKEIAEFCCEDSLNNHTQGKKGFIASFASKTTSTTTMINGITRNSDYNNLKGFEEIICVAVNV